MSVWPALSSVPYIAPITKTIRTKTLISTVDSEKEFAKQKWLYPKRNWNLKYQGLTIAQARTLWQFFLSRKGQYTSFVIFDTVSDTYTQEYVGTGDGSATVFNLPSKNAASYTLYLNGVSQVESTDYDFYEEGGADGEDKVVFTSAPTDTYPILWTFTGYLKGRVRFAQDDLSFEVFYSALVNTGITLRGLLNS